MAVQFDDDWLRKYTARTGLGARGADDHQAPVLPDKPKRSKFGNIKTVVDGIEFDSKREAARYSELMTLLRAGEIYGVFRQHPFLLPGGVVYRADFVVLNRDGTYTVEDAKGVRTKEYRIKKRLMKNCLGVEIVEV